MSSRVIYHCLWWIIWYLYIMPIDNIDNISWYIRIVTNKYIVRSHGNCSVDCLFGVFPFHSRFFRLFGRITITGEGQPTTNFDLYSALMAMSSEVSLLCHTYCDISQPFIMVISEDLWQSHLLPSIWHWSCHDLFQQLSSVPTGIKPWSPAC